MNPEGKKNIFKADKIYARAIGSAEDDWQELGSAVLELTDPEPLRIGFRGLDTVRTFTVTNTFKMTKLEYRAFMRLFGMKNPSLIHNGKKRRK